MKPTTYRALLLVAVLLCSLSTVVCAETLDHAKSSLSQTLLAVGIADWMAVSVVSVTFGLVSLLQRFKNAEADDSYVLFVFAHMGGSFISGIVVFLSSESMLDSPNRFAQALAIGAAGWSGSKVADRIARAINDKTERTRGTV